MRGQFFKVFLAASCFLSACVVAARAAAPPTVTPPTSPTLVPTPSLTPAPTLPPTPPPGSLNLPSAKASVDRARAMDAAFMTRVQVRGLELAELGRIAADRASNPGVRAFGQQIVQDRGKAAEELRLFAQSEAIALPTALDADRRAEVDHISKLSPPALDRAIVLAMVRLYDADVADFQKQTQMGQEVELQGWVYDTLPLLEDQREQIHKIASELGIPVRAGP
jgi:putative membrane protein